MTPVPEVKFRLPGGTVEPDAAGQLEWYQSQYGQMSAQLAAAQTQIENFQMSGLDDQEAAQLKYQKEKQVWQNQMATWEEQQAHQKWGDYYAQFSDNPDSIRGMNDPIQMGHTVITDLHQTVRQQAAEIEALKKAVTQPTSGPPVSTGSQSPASIDGKRRLFDLSNDERDTFMRKARMGQMDNAEIPVL